MHYHVKEIALDDGFARYKVKNHSAEKPTVLPNLSKVNILVGANNSGKSRFLRRLASTEKLTFEPRFEGEGQIAVDQMNAQLRHFLDQAPRILEGHGALERGGVLDALANAELFKYVREEEQFTSPVTAMLDKARVRLDLASRTRQPGHTLGGLQDCMQAMTGLATSTFNEISSQVQKLKIQYKFKKLYIPMLRGLRDFPFLTDAKDKTRDAYSERTHNDYFPKSKPVVWTGLTLYEEIKRLLLGDWAERQKVKEFEQFLGKNFFEGAAVELIPQYDATVLSIKIGREHQYPVQSLGDGLQSIIILTFPLFKHRSEKVLMFCEEPELNLHPGMQRAFLRLLADGEFPDQQFFFTTHSNHFLDLTADFKNVSVYTFRKQIEPSNESETHASFEIENVSNEDRRPLELLGVRNSSVFLSNCTIWVEGITDRRYFKHFLQLYQEQLPERERFREDSHYSFVEYGGACITHWSFLENENDSINVDWLCGRLFLIADGDTGTKWKETRHQRLENALGHRYCRLKCKEVENLLSQQTITAVLREYKETEIQPFKYNDYQNSSLGSFIEEKVLTKGRKRPGSYVDNGTISDKVGFCSKAVESMKSLADLTDEAKNVAERLYKFIGENNRK